MQIFRFIIGYILLTLTTLVVSVNSFASIGEVALHKGNAVIDRKDGDQGVEVKKDLDVFSYDTVKTGNGKVGINETSPDNMLHVRNDNSAAAKIGGEGGAAYYMEIGQLASSGSPGLNATGSSTSMLFQQNGTEKFRLDSSGRLLIGHTASITTYGVQDRLQVSGTDYATSGIAIRRDSADAGGGNIIFGKSRGSQGGVTVVQSGDSLGELVWCGADGTDVTSYAGTINCSVDGTPGSNDMPGRLTFSTAADGAAGVTERMRITSAGLVGINNDSPATVLDIISTKNKKPSI